MAQSYTPLVGTDLFSDSYTTLNNSDEALRTVFAGTAAPTSPVSYQLWLDTTNNLLKQRNTANDGWLALGKFATDMGHLALDGGQMTAPGGGGTGLDMNGAAITNLPAGSGTGPSRQQEVDLKAPLASPAFTTDATLNVDPVSGNSLTRQSYTDGRYLKKTGDTLTGALNLSGDGTAAFHPISKQQFDAEFSGTGHKHDGTASEGRKILAADLDTTGGANLRALRSDGAGNPVWSAYSSFLSGAVTDAGAKDTAYTDFLPGSWTPVHIAAGYIRIDVTGFTNPPQVLVNVNVQASDAAYTAHAVATSSTQIFVRTWKVGLSAVNEAYPFTFLAWET